MAVNGLTNVQKKMLAILSDGLPHSRQELHACLSDDMGPLSNIQSHISGIRKVLRPKGQDILCEIFNRTVHYRQVRLLASAINGRR